jgi:hypothetical protein
MVVRLIEFLLRQSDVSQVLLTLNIPETLVLPCDSRIKVLNNASPMGFASNHNRAFKYCTQAYFCPLNPDIDIVQSPFPALLDFLQQDNFDLAAPLVLSPQGAVEDSVRRFPTLRSLLAKLLGAGDDRYVLREGDAPFSPEWVAGMFMLFRSDAYLQLGGFDEGFFLYYEDVDICVRTWKMGMRIVVVPTVSVIHDARRDSHRSLRHLRWHVASMLRYFFKHWQSLPKVIGGTVK